jgi:uncharacterized Rossmann fold enzyme
MITVLTVWKTGGVYGREYVERLHKAVTEHLNIPHRFVCLTDGEVDGVETIPLKYGWPGWWSKVEMFRPDLEDLGTILFLDLSCVIVGSLDTLASHEGEIVTKDFYYGGPSQSVFKFRPGKCRQLWDAFTANADHWMKEGDRRIPPHFGDQILMTKVWDQPIEYWQDVYPGQVVSYKVHCRDGIPPDARIVKFHGSPRIHECEEPWVRFAWETGISPPKMNDSCNVEYGTLRDQIRANSKRDLTWHSPDMKRKGGVCIVGGAPSLKNSLNAIKVRKRFGDEIWAANGAHDYLIENGIIPDVMVMMDARPENVRFVRNPHPRVTYWMASRVHPSVLDALEGHKVVLWHSYQPGEIEALEGCERPFSAVGGGNTVVLRALYLCAALGLRRLNLFGVDSSYSEGHHVYDQPMNDGEAVETVFVGEREFKAAGWMVRQAQNFMDQAKILLQQGCVVSVHGTGLLPYVAELMGKPDEQSTR